MSGYVYAGDAYEGGRTAALIGRPIFANPCIGGEAELWFCGYRSVPDAERGSRPDLKPTPRVVRRAKKTRSSEAHVRALGDRTLPGSTPKPWAIDGVGW